ncbi:MAG: flagellar basal body P-ring protein FlgI [Pseudomonadota bacterium]
MATASGQHVIGNKDLYSTNTIASFKFDNGKRIKDIVDIEGVRENILVGYGLIVGLNGTGDNLNNTAFTKKELQEFLGKLGISTKGTDINTKNVAAVTVTTSLPAFSRHGSRIDVTVSTIGDAKSIEGGILLATPLLGADGNVYAVAQGQVSIGGFNVTDKSASTSNKGIPTKGKIMDGAIIEREVAFDINQLDQITLALKNPDITTAEQIAYVINASLENDIALALDPGSVELTVPIEFDDNVMPLLSDIEQLRVKTDQVAKIVIDEDSGTIVMGQNVQIDTVAIAQGNLLIRINEDAYIVKPDPFALVGTREANAAEIAFLPVEPDDENRMTIFDDGATLKDLVAGLNSLGVGPRDLITILQTIKAAGAIQAEIITI